MKLNDWNEKKVQLRTLLINCAIEGVPATYGELADQCGIEKEERRFPNYFWELLMEIGDEEDAVGRPWINALAVTKKERLPGAKFYEWAETKDPFLAQADIYFNHVFFKSVSSKCHRYWLNVSKQK